MEPFWPPLQYVIRRTPLQASKRSLHPNMLENFIASPTATANPLSTFSPSPRQHHHPLHFNILWLRQTCNNTRIKKTISDCGCISA